MLRSWVFIGIIVVAMAVAPVTATAREDSNEAPLADAGLDQDVELGTIVLLDATGSRDPDGEIETYEWRIETPGGATIVPQCPTCKQSRFRPTRAGTYTVSVTVTDDDGVQSTDTLYVTVGDPSRRTGDSANPDTPPATPPSATPTTNPIGNDPPSSAPACTNPPCSSSSGPSPWVDIEGPSRVATDEQAGFVLEYGGFRQEPQFGWSIGADGVTGVQEWNSPGSETIYVTAASDDSIARDSHDITITENQKPNVNIQTPEKLHSGQTITLTAEASDPDGWVVDVEWRGGPTVTVPEGQNKRQITVTVTDNNRGTATDSVELRGEVIRQNTSQPSARHTVYCYYTQESERMRQNPDHCEVGNSDNSDDGDGYQSTTSNLARMLESPHFNIIWKKTDEPIRQHSGDVADSVGVRMPDVVDNDGSTPTTPTLTDNQRDAIMGDAVTTSTSSFTLEGKTVSNDLNGDGEIDAGDWDERFGSDDDSPTDTHDEAVSEAKDARRATNRATGGGGPAASDDDIGASNTDSFGGVSDGSGSGGNDGGSSDPGGGDLSDSLTDVSVGDHAADKGERIADDGLDMGVGY